MPGSPRRRARGADAERRFLYVAAPGIRNYVEHGGIGILVFDIDAGYRFVRRIPTFEVPAGSAPENIKGIAAHAGTSRLYLTTPLRVAAFDLTTDRLVWNRQYPGGATAWRSRLTAGCSTCRRLKGRTGTRSTPPPATSSRRSTTESGAHNTIYGPDGRHVYLAGLKSPMLNIADPATHTVTARVGPFGHSIRPFTVNAAQTRAYVNVNDLLGFEVGDITTGRVLHRVEVTGYQKGPVKRHGCPSHGIGLTPDEREIWLADGANSMLHVFDNTVAPPKQVASIAGARSARLDHLQPGRAPRLSVHRRDLRHGHQERDRDADRRDRARRPEREGRGGGVCRQPPGSHRRSVRHRAQAAERPEALRHVRAAERPHRRAAAR